MTDRLLLAYALIAFLVVWLGAFIWWRYHNSYQQVEGRERKRRRAVNDAHARKLAEKAEDEGRS